MKHHFKPKTKQLLYHYTTISGAEAILKTNTLRLSEFSKMNDSSEYAYAKSKFIKFYQARQVWVEEVPRYMVNIKLAAHEHMTTMMIGCLTMHRDDIGLWDRYAQNGAGCVIGIDANWLAARAGVTVRLVSYDATNLRRFVNTGLAMLQDHYTTNPADRVELAELATMFVLDLYAFKDPRFRSEMEVRVSRLTVTDAQSPHGLRDPGGHRADGSVLPELAVGEFASSYGLKRFVDLPLRDTQTTSAIRTVGFGPKASAANEASLKNAAGAADIKFWRSDAPLR